MKRLFLIQTVLLSLLTMTSCNLQKPNINNPNTNDNTSNNEESDNSNDGDNNDPNNNNNNNNEEDSKDESDNEFRLKTVNYKEIVDRFKATNYDLTLEENKRDLLFYSFYKFSKSTNSLILDRLTYQSLNGDTIEDNLRLKLNNKGFVQREASTGIDALISFNFANKIYYENSFNNIVVNEATSLDKFKDNTSYTSKELLLNEYIQTYGKLDFNSYKVDKDFNFNEYGYSNNLDTIDTTSIFQFDRSLIKEYKFTKLSDNTYNLDFKLDKTSAIYFAKRYQKLFQISEAPHMDQDITCSFKIDKDLNLVLSYYNLEFKSTMGLQINNQLSWVSRYYSSNSSLVIKDKELKIPEVNEDLTLKLDSHLNII